MKRITALVLALVMVAALFVCNGFTLREPSDPKATEEPEETEKPTWYTSIKTSEDDFGDEIQYIQLNAFVV